MNGGNVSFAGDAREKTIINQIMLKFRPIAPKPVTEGSVSGSAPAERKSELGKKRRTKRKYVRVKKSSKLSDYSDESNDLEMDSPAVTLQLLPEMTGLNDSKAAGSSTNLDFPVKKPPGLMNFDSSENNRIRIYTVRAPEESDRTESAPPMTVVESWIMVERITNGWVDGGGLGRTDTEKMKHLEVDTCPGFVSDGFDRVLWVNLAYRRMVDPSKQGVAPPAEAVVCLVVKEKISVSWEAFACTVRVVYTWRKVRYYQTMPCDVWKMEFGRFAWRLDANTALSLGL